MKKLLSAGLALMLYLSAFAQEKVDTLSAAIVRTDKEKREARTQTSLQKLDSRQLARGFALLGSPDLVKTLQTLPGVGRKTANVVCAVIWNQPTMAVDTHIFRISERIGLTTNSKSPLETEKQLVRYIPAELIPKAHHWLLLHGRYVCKARKPLCETCGIKPYCKTGAKA